MPVGRRGWLPDISTNLSFVGLRGFENIPGQPFRFVYQFETQIDISATSGIGESNSNESNTVKGGLTSRNTYIGLADPAYGSLLIGKTDAPYKVSTARLNPFLGEWGDNGAIIGNTGGDNRVEFGTRLDHSIWYESPEFARGFKATVLYSPGQNRSANSDNIAAGESDCAGGNIPGSGGSLPYACNDGAFSDAFSASLTYTHGPLYVALAYERHEKVNRSSDLTGEYANPPSQYFNADTADEDAAKIGVQYSLPINLTLDGIFERLHRHVPSSLNFQNERSRTGFWLAATQIITPRDNVSIGWAHAGRTPGDPGQHNTALQTPPLGAPGDATGGAHEDNVANLITHCLQARPWRGTEPLRRLGNHSERTVWPLCFGGRRTRRHYRLPRRERRNRWRIVRPALLRWRSPNGHVARAAVPVLNGVSPPPGRPIAGMPQR